MVDGTSVADVLTFARSGESRSYDLIGYRAQSVTAISGLLPLQTLAGELAAEDRHEASKTGRLLELRRRVKALSFDFELSEGRFRYEISDREFRFIKQFEGDTTERWFSRAHPPSVVLQHAADDDEGPLVAHHIQLRGADIWWLPFTELLERGRFVRMQEGASRLTDALDPQCYYLFVSHHWLDTDNPDPGGRQAALVAWQIVGHLLNALWVGAARGRHTPRKRGQLGPALVGTFGSGLAESILVNLLRPLPEETFTALLAEAEAFDDVADGFGARQALADIGLQGLRARLDKAHHLRDLLARFRVWYDYACMPQHPRTAEEQVRFEALLEQLGAIQVLGRTVVLLDRVENYFGRGWCTFESTLAHERMAEQLDVWHGGAEAPVDFYFSKEAAFRRVLMDRPYLVWRGILDTELFQIQSHEECMSRLDLETTRPEDRTIVYGLLRELGAPRSIHNDDVEVLTGVFPLPLQAGKAVVAESGRPAEGRTPTSVSTVDVADANVLVAIGPEGLPAFEQFDDAGTVHVAIVGRCEGEAVLYAHWVREHRTSLAAALGAPVRSLSWVASDVAPVGHFAVGDLTIRAVPSDLWIVLAPGSSLGGGYTARVLIESLAAAGIEYAELVIDQAENNLHRHDPRPAGEPEQRKELRQLDLDNPALTRHAGGLFRPQLLQCLRSKP